MSQNAQLKAKLAYHLRKMLAIERKLENPSQAILQKEWLAHQKQAEDALWYAAAEVTTHQKNLVFRWT